MKFQKLGKSTILAVTLCLASASPAWANVIEYDWVQTSGSPSFSGYLLLDAASGTDIAASTAIVGWSISGGSLTYIPSDSVLSGDAFLTWGPIGGGASQIISISPDLFINEERGGHYLTINEGSMSEGVYDPPGGFYLNGITPTSTVPDISNTAVLFLLGLAGLAGFNLSFRRARRGLLVNPTNSPGASGMNVSHA